jgi:vacuolar-type H+-ATPase subunit H
MLSDTQRERLIQASAVGKEIKQGSHGEQWENLTEETRERALRRIAEVDYELVMESPSDFNQEQIEHIKNDRKKILRRETKKGLRFNYKTKKLESIK